MATAIVVTRSTLSKHLCHSPGVRCCAVWQPFEDKTETELFECIVHLLLALSACVLVECAMLLQRIVQTAYFHCYELPLVRIQ